MLVVSGISKQYGKKSVLQAVDFTLSPGECLGVAGHNGSGKSTLLSIVAQVTPPTAGHVMLGGQNVLGDRHFLRTSLGYVPQQNCLLGDITVRETLRFWQKTYGLGGQNLFAPQSPCTMLGLAPLLDKRVGTLSGGMQKRVSIALALMHNPRYLLLDEVLPALDRHYRAALRAWLGQFCRRGGSVLYCSHEIEELTTFCSTVLVLRQGVTMFYGTAANFPADAESLDFLMNPAPSAV